MLTAHSSVLLSSLLRLPMQRMAVVGCCSAGERHAAINTKSEGRRCHLAAQNCK